MILPLVVVGCGETKEAEVVTSSRAYKGHESDRDANNFVSAYPQVQGTRLDDCQTCHTGGTFTSERKGQTVSVFNNACDFCHLIIHPQEELTGPQPTAYRDTLNSFGAAYLEAGRSREALSGIASSDSDGDGHENDAEIKDLKYPGDPQSKPGQEVAPMVTFSMEQLRALQRHGQFLLANSHKQQYDQYVHYEGVRISTLLEQAGVNLQDVAIQGVTVIAPDGYLKDFTSEEISKTYPAGIYYEGLDNAALGTECGFVQYPDQLPASMALVSGQAIPGEQYLMLADLRDTQELEPCNLDISSGRINGEGPLRIVVPQGDPGRPDRGSSTSPTTCSDGHDYDDAKDHNAGAMVRGVVALRVNPLPAGYEDFDHINGGWAFINSRSIIVYGHGVKAD